MRPIRIIPMVTNRDCESLEKYLTEIGKTDLLSGDEESELFRRIKTGDAKALELLTKSNLRFVVSVAKKYQYYGVPLADLINEGNLGLIQAAKRYDETKGFKFISYAVWWIRQCILKSISENGRIVRLPYDRYRDDSSHRISIDSPLGNDDDMVLLDVIADENSPVADSGLLQESLSKDMVKVLDTLSDMERKILKASFGIGEKELTLSELACKYGMTRERVRQIKEKAIRRLRSSIATARLAMYLG